MKETERVLTMTMLYVLLSSGSTDKLALLLDFTIPGDSYVNMVLREIVDLEKSGFNDLCEANKRAVEEEKLELELEREAKNRKEREARQKERLEKERLEKERIEKERVEKEKKEKPKERLDGGIKKVERLDGGVGKERRARSRELSKSSSSRVRVSKERLDGGVLRKSRSRSNRRSPEFHRLGSREVSRHSNSRIEIRVGNDRVRSRSRSLERPFDRFPRLEDHQASFDGIPICEFNTLPNEDPYLDDSYQQNTPSRGNVVRMTGEFRLNDAGIRVWESPPRERISRFEPLPEERRQTHNPFDAQPPRQSVFDGRLEPRPMLRNPDPPEILEPGRLLEPSPFMRNVDDLRNRLNESSYDPEREFHRFEQEVQELDRECRREQELRLREQDDRVRFSRENLRDDIDFVERNDRRRTIDAPLSPEIAQKLRRLDEEALRLDLKRVTRLQNFDAIPNNRREEEDIEFDAVRRNIPETRRDFMAEDRGISRENLNRSREMEEFERNFFQEREKSRMDEDRNMQFRERMMDRFNESRNRLTTNDMPRRFMDDMPFGIDPPQETIRSPSPPKRQNMEMFDQKSRDIRSSNEFNTQNDRFGQKEMFEKSREIRTNNEFNPQNDRFGQKNMDPREFMSGMSASNNNFGPPGSFSGGGMTRNVSQFGQGSGNMSQGPFQGINRQNFDNFGQNQIQRQNQDQNQGQTNQFRGDLQQQNQQNRGIGMNIDIKPWNQMMSNRQNSPPKQFSNMQQQQQPMGNQWMNQENPNFGASNSNLGNFSQFGGGGNGGPMFNPNASGGGGMNQNFNNPQMMNFSNNNLFQNPMMSVGGMGGGMTPNMRFNDNNRGSMMQNAPMQSGNSGNNNMHSGTMNNRLVYPNKNNNNNNQRRNRFTN